MILFKTLIALFIGGISDFGSKVIPNPIRINPIDGKNQRIQESDYFNLIDSISPDVLYDSKPNAMQHR